MKYPTAGGAPTILAEGDAANWVVSVVVYNGWVVWIEGADVWTRRLFAMPESGGDVRQIATLDGAAWMLVPDSTGFYFTTSFAEPGNAGHIVGGAVTHLACTWQ